MLVLDNFKYASPDKGFGNKCLLKRVASLALVINQSYNFQYFTQLNPVWRRFHLLGVSINNKRGTDESLYILKVIGIMKQNAAKWSEYFTSMNFDVYLLEFHQEFLEVS